MRVTSRGGRTVLHLAPVEVELLSGLLDELDTAVRSDDAADPVVARLYPSAHPDDPDAAALFRDLTEDGLREDRTGRIAACLADLAAAGDVDLGDPADATRWIQVLNDLRLALGTRLGVTEDDEPLAPDDEPRLIYHWLTALQDTLVTRLMR